METLFTGRMRRKNYFIQVLVLSIVMNLALLVKAQYPILYWAVVILCDIVAVVLTVRRLHDIGRRGFVAVLCFVPIVNELFMLYLTFKRGDVGANLYGEDPRD